MTLPRASASGFGTIAFYAANKPRSRHGHVLIGGKNANSALSDVWVSNLLLLSVLILLTFSSGI
jgi:hypothetical protein